jgi:1-acyl-sn-glycerol-3-phosphate acyltransferase
MYHVIRNQYLDQLRPLLGPIVLLCREGEDGGQVRRALQAALDQRPLTVIPAAAVTERPLDPQSWVVPVHVVRSRFSRGDDRLSRWSRQLGRQRRPWADTLNGWLGSRVELVCGAPIAGSDAAGIGVALASLRTEHLPPVVPALDDLWPGVRDILASTVGTVAADTRHQLQRMANRYRLLAATALRGTVHYLSRRFFRNIWTYGMVGIEALPPDAHLVYLPCHRSHFDYMVLPYALNELGQTCPFIAAGDNLNFFGIGRVLQAGFAFFIRRTFGNDIAYRTLCSAYMGEALRHGLPLAFFPEGGRSRDGWMRSPKIGMLQMVREQVSLTEAPVYAIPVHLAYERCPDGKSLAKQSLGRRKRQESIFRFLKALKLLVADHGRVFLSFAEPIRLTALDGASDAEAKASTMTLAQQVLQRINAQIVVTGPALVAVSLLLRGYEATIATLTADSATLATYVHALSQATGWPVSLAPDETQAMTAERGVVRVPERQTAAPNRDERSCRHDLALLGLGTDPAAITVTDRIQRASLDWHLGAIGHVLAPLGLVARHLADGGSLSSTDLQELAMAWDGLRQDATLRLYWPEETASSTILAGVTAFLVQQGHCRPLADDGFVSTANADAALWQRWAALAPSEYRSATENRTVLSP